MNQKGIEKRQAKLAKLLIPRLCVGMPLPRCRELAPLFGVSYGTTHTDLHRVLHQAGVSWRRDGASNRIIVTGLRQ